MRTLQPSDVSTQDEANNKPTTNDINSFITTGHYYNMQETLTPTPAVTAIDFDESGNFLAVGLSTGIIQIYTKKGPLFSLYIQFFSHENEIVRLRWCKGQSVSMLILVTTVNSTRLWKIVKSVATPVQAPLETSSLFAKKKPSSGSQRPAKEALKREFSNTTPSHIAHNHSLSLNSDGETFLTADELRVYLWNLGAEECFNMLNLAPEDLHQLTEVLRIAEFHPQHCNILAYGTSAGAVRISDLRASALCDKSWKPLGDGPINGHRTPNNKLSYSGPLEEYMQGVLDLTFDTQSGLYLAVREFGQVKVWDLRVEDRPLVRHPVMPRHQLLAHLYNRFEDGMALDTFRCLFIGGESLRIATGTYSDQCIIWDVNGGGEHKVVHVGKEKTSSILTLLQNGPKRRKFFEEDVDMGVDGYQEAAMYGESVNSLTSQSNIGVQAFGNTRTKSFSGDMKSEYMVEWDGQEDTVGEIQQQAYPLKQSINGNGLGNQPISFARKTSVLAADVSRDVFALAASGQLYVYDIKR